jgi:hypothetical protein
MDLLISAVEKRDQLSEEERSALRFLPVHEATFHAGEEIIPEG